MNTFSNSRPLAAASTEASTDAGSLTLTTSWYQAPNERGTWQLLVTCLTTINICVWTAVHLNIPAEILPLDYRSFKVRMWRSHHFRRIRWLLLGLIAPELVVYAAWRQWMAARIFVQKLNWIIRAHSEEATSDRAMENSLHESISDISMVHGFYAGMGGFCFDYHPELHDHEREGSAPSEGPSSLSMSMMHQSENSSRRKRRHRRSRQIQDCETGRTNLYPSMIYGFTPTADVKPPPRKIYLTANAVLFLIHAGKLAVPSKDYIIDRSKSDVFAKTIVCIQAGYMILQVATRLRYGFPVTFLEINTLAHVLCALVMYIFWFNKPQNILYSLTLDPELAKCLSGWYQVLTGAARGMSYDELERFYSLYQVIWSMKSLRSQQSTPHEMKIISGYPSSDEIEKLPPGTVVFFDVETDTDARLTTEELRHRLQSSHTFDMFSTVYHGLSGATPAYFWGPRSVTRRLDWARVPNLFYNDLFDNSGKPSYKIQSLIEALLRSNTEPVVLRGSLRDNFREEISNWPDGGALSAGTALPAIAIAMFTALYGGLHAVAWRAFFPSTVEQWMWRISSVIIAGSGSVFALSMVTDRLSWHYYLQLFLKLTRWPLVVFVINIVLLIFNLIRIDMTTQGIKWSQHRVKFSILYTLIGLSFISRIFLVVESFVSLRRVPIEVYKTPNWTQWLPHI